MSTSQLLKLVPQELHYSRPTIPDEQNALDLWQQAVPHLHPAEGEDKVFWELVYGTDKGEPARLPTGDEWERLWKLAESNSRAIALFDEGTSRGGLQLPLPVIAGSDGFSPAESEIINAVRTVHCLRVVRSKLLIASKQFAQAVENLIALLHTGHLMCNGENTLVMYMIGLGIRKTALRGLKTLAAEPELATELRNHLIAELERTQLDPTSLAQSYQFDFCSWTLPTLYQMPEDLPSEALVDFLLEQWYSNTTMGDLLAEMGEDSDDERISDEVRHARIADRKRQLMILLDGHPRLFDKRATVRLVGEDTAEYLRSLNSQPPTVWQRICGWLPGSKSTPADRLADFWPALLEPGFPLDMFGNDPQAVTKREELWEDVKVNCEVEEYTRLGKDFEPPTDAQLREINQQLRGIDNPVGLLLRGKLSPTNISSLQSDHDEMLSDTLRLLQAWGGSQEGVFPEY